LDVVGVFRLLCSGAARTVDAERGSSSVAPRPRPRWRASPTRRRRSRA